MAVIVSIKKLIHRVAHQYPGGLVQLAADMGINYNTLKSKVNHAIDTHYFSGEELALLADLASTNEIADYYADRRGLMCIKKPDFDGISDAALLDLFLTLQSQQGEWANEIKEAMSSGDVDFDQVVSIKKKHTQFLVASAEIMSRIECFMAASEERRAARTKQ